MAILDEMARELKTITEGEFSTPAVITVGVGSLNVNLIFDRNTVEITGEGVIIIGDTAQCMVYVTDIDTFLGHPVTEADTGLTVMIGSRNYKIKNVDRDDMGFARIELKKS